MNVQPLPIDPFIPAIQAALHTSRAAVITAQPGAGKTTRVPPALVQDGPVLILQPRRVAARAVATRIASERGWTIGREVGWQIRFERRFSAETRLLVATEGVLTARAQQDPLLSAFRTVVIDEFHERSIHGDLAIALAKQAWLARSDLHVVVMSATLDSGPVAAFLGGCPVVDVPGRLFPIDVTYAPGETVADATAVLLDASRGDVLCFLPGAAEIRRATGDIGRQTAARHVDVLALYGAQDGTEQDRALRPGTRRRVIVATNIAETSVTVPGVTAVVDAGLQKVARYDADRGVDSLELERISVDSADQRAGRAGREAPGIVRRLWNERDRLQPHREPEIHRVDLSAAVLDVIAWGGDPRTFEWFEAPSAETVDAAMALLSRLGAVADGRLSEIGERMRALPLHPRLARMLLEGGGARDIARACAIVSERHLIAPRTAATASDLLSAIDRWADLPPHVDRVARELEDMARRDRAGAARPMDEAAFRRAVLAGYPDRVAQRREPHSPRVRLASGAGAVIGPESGVVEGEFLVAVDVYAGKWGRESFPRPGTAAPVPVSGRGNAPSPRFAALRKTTPVPVSEARIRIASRVEREWLVPTGSQIVHRFDAASGTVRAARVEKYDALVLAETPVPPAPDIAADLLAAAWRERPTSDDDARVLRRLRFAGRDIDLHGLVRAAARAARSLRDLSIARALPHDVACALEQDAPEMLRVPSGREVRLEYGDDGTVSASVKLQELFGLADTPRVGPNRIPVTIALLAPNGRPVQTTRDLRSFWDRTYPEVRKELRGRYPKHPWPDDPWRATPTHRTVTRKTKG